MFRFTIIPAVTAVALMTAAFQDAPPPPAPVPLTPVLAALAEDAGAARDFDYMALKAEGVDLKAMSDAVWRRAVTPGGPQRCLTEAEGELQANLAAAAEAADRATFDDDRAAAADAWARWTLFAEGIENGQIATEEPFKWASDRYTALAAETNPRARELLRRTAKDQLYRYAFGGGTQVWGELSPAATARVHGRLIRATCSLDHDNTEWLKADVAANGWYTISATGAAASNSAWLMAQHADNDRDFQRHVLAILEPLAASGEVRPANHAYLYDRVAVGEDRPQRYATQGRCVAPGRWEPNTLEDPERVEAMRAEVGIGPLEQYQTRMHTHCTDFGG
ncbi:DUF6624 domain-containing protein [Brevundimonas sp. GCM10030266]|uniref:DUF6624 domain-containing protein n=1 Tax=Brevundimonas sp. GCM10030266 TaxID=3273386 RepID=UPI00361AD956